MDHLAPHCVDQMLNITRVNYSFCCLYVLCLGECIRGFGEGIWSRCYVFGFIFSVFQSYILNMQPYFKQMTARSELKFSSWNTRGLNTLAKLKQVFNRINEGQYNFTFTDSTDSWDKDVHSPPSAKRRVSCALDKLLGNQQGGSSTSTSREVSLWPCSRGGERVHESCSFACLTTR